MYYRAKRYDEAISYYTELYSIQKDKSGIEHSSTLLTRSYVAICYYKSGDRARAVSIMQEVCDAYKRTLGEGHKATVNALNILEKMLADKPSNG